MSFTATPWELAGESGLTVHCETHEMQSCECLPELTEQIVRLTAERDEALREAAGYQQALKLACDTDERTVIAVIHADGTQMRVYGPDANCEKRFAETVAQYFVLIHETIGALKEAGV